MFGWQTRTPATGNLLGLYQEETSG